MTPRTAAGRTNVAADDILLLCAAPGFLIAEEMGRFHMARSLRETVRLVAGLNLGYFGVEFAVALAIGSVSLFADSIDFLEDTSINFLILIALAWSARNRARIGMLLAG